MLAGDVELVLELVAQRNYASAARIDKIAGIFSPTAAATQQSDSHGGVGSAAAHQAGLDQYRPGCSRGDGDEFSPGDFICQKLLWMHCHIPPNLSDQFF